MVLTDASITGIRISALLLVCTAWAGASGALAQSYPSRRIQLVTGNPPGGATDFIARIIGPPLGARLGQNIVIDNRPSANGIISAEVVARAAPDGYTLLYANDSVLVVNPPTTRR
jgi:tripartite-type tricarboxylate transporter receptor subunit TctC